MKTTPDEGILFIDKPAGLTSHDVVRRIRSISGIRRVGHTGTLDPLATGLLIVCVGRFTRLAEYLVELPKTYDVTILLGQATKTYDAEGDIISDAPVIVSEAKLAEVLEKFRGDIRQIPPMFSAVKVDGQPLYKHARRGLEVERPARTVSIYELEVLEWDSPELLLRILCSSGTYIRSLAHDLGQMLGCGGHVTALRRTAVGPFNLEQAVPLSKLQITNWCEFLHPGDLAVGHFPQLILTSAEATKIRNGQQLPRQTGEPDGKIVRAYDEKGHFVGIVTATDDRWQARKIFHPI